MKSFVHLLLCVLFSTALASSAQALTMQLHGLGPAWGVSNSQYGHGAQGLYLGDSWSYRDHHYTNWTWNSLELDIQMSGDATIIGSMTRGDGSIWGINIQLTDLQLVGNVFASTTNVYENILDDLVQSGENGAGIEFGALSLSLTAPYATAVPLTGWTGLSMPSMGHNNVAELHYRDGELRFDAWYQNEGNRRCAQAYCYDVGDTKAVVGPRPSPGASAVPEPSAAMVFGLGLLVVAGGIRRRR